MKGGRSQIALEFIIILGISLFLVSMVFLVISSKADVIYLLQSKKYLDDYMDSIGNEIFILNQMLPGYRREVQVPAEILNNYIISIVNRSFIIKDNVTDDYYIYTYPYNGSVFFINKTLVDGGVSYNATFIVFES